MSSLFQKQATAIIHIGSMDLNQLRDYYRNLSDEKEIERCPEASFMNGDKLRAKKVIENTVHDVIKATRKNPKLK